MKLKDLEEWQKQMLDQIYRQMNAGEWVRLIEPITVELAEKYPEAAKAKKLKESKLWKVLK